MKTIAINAQARTLSGKGPNRRLRRDKQIPVILYGQNAEPVMLALDNRQFQQAVSKVGDEMVMFEIQSESAGIGSQLAVIRDVQRDPVTEFILHLDMMRVDVTQAIDVEVAIHGIGAPIGVRDGGILEQVLRTLHLRCLPTLVPSHLDVDISNLAVNQAIHVSDLPLAEGVELLTGVGDVVFHVVVPRKADEAAAGEAKAAEPEAAAGKKPEAAGAKKPEAAAGKKPEAGKK